MLPFSQRVLRRPDHPGSYDIEDPARVDVPCVPVVRRFPVMVRYAFLGRRVDQTAAVLAVPEVAWTAFATVLSMAVAAKNG